MAITTTDSINVAQAPVCSRCGHDGSLMNRDANGKLVHFDDCPKGPAPERVGMLIAHDALNPEMGADIRALERLRELGRGLTMERQSLSNGVMYAKKVVELDTDELRRRMALTELLDFGGGGVPEAVVGEPYQKPLKAKDKPEPELEIDWSKAGNDKG